MTTSTLTPPADTASISTTKEAPADDRQDLHERSLAFARDVRTFVRKTPRTIASLADCRNVIKASGAIGAQYLLADDAVSREMFIQEMRGCRRQCKQTIHWLQLLDANLDERSEAMRSDLLKEANELERIFNAIVWKMIGKKK